MAMRRRTSLGKWMMTWSENRPDLPVTTPSAPLARPEVTRALLPTQAKMLRPRFRSAFWLAMLTPGCTQSPAQPNALSPTDTL